MPGMWLWIRMRGKWNKQLFCLASDGLLTHF